MPMIPRPDVRKFYKQLERFHARRGAQTGQSFEQSVDEFVNRELEPLILSGRLTIRRPPTQKDSHQ